jgi:hypothetical protein
MHKNYKIFWAIISADIESSAEKGKASNRTKAPNKIETNPIVKGKKVFHPNSSNLSYRYLGNIALTRINK